MPVFGIRKPERGVVLRSGIYGITINIDGKVMIVKNRLGLFLPGGGSKPRESHEETLKREFIEETGYDIKVGRRLETLSWYIDTPDYYFKQVFNTGIFYEVELKERVSTIVEENHEVLFIDGEKATNLHSDAQMWAVYRYVLEKKYPRFATSNEQNSEKRIYPLRLVARTIIAAEEDKIVLLKSADMDWYSIPGGGVMRGEDVRQAAIREANEEPGYTISDLVPIGSCVEYSTILQLSYYYAAKADGAAGKRHLTDMEADWGICPILVALDEAEALLQKNEGVLMHFGFDVSKMANRRNLAALAAYRQALGGLKFRDHRESRNIPRKEK